MSDKIQFKWVPGGNYAKITNANMQFKALLLEYIASPSTGHIQARLIDKDNTTALNVHCGSAISFMRCMAYCFSNMDPDDWHPDLIPHIKIYL